MSKRKFKINIPNPAEVFNETFMPWIYNAEETAMPVCVLEGGRNSGKSRATAQKVILRALKKKTSFAIIRKVADTIRDSFYKEIEDQAKEWGLTDHFNFLSSPLSIRIDNGSEFITRGLDKAEKIKSLANVDIAIIEEATELTKSDWDTLEFTIRGQHRQRILLFNRTAGNWTEKEFFNADGTPKKKPNVYHLHTTFLDNKFLASQDIERFEQLKRDDPEAYRKIAEGIPVKLKGLIYQFESIDSFPDNCAEIIHGVDFGYSPDPSVVLKIGRIGMNLYLEQMIYDYKLTNTDLIKKMSGISKTDDMYGDIAEPDRIEEIYRAGFNIHDKETTVKDVDWGIDVCRRYKIHIVTGSTQTEKDFNNYKWKTDKNGEPIAPPTPAHEGSHAPDAMRYPVASHFGKEYLNLTLKEIKESYMEEMESITVSDGW
jgi:phage terminase large subunit